MPRSTTWATGVCLRVTRVSTDFEAKKPEKDRDGIAAERVVSELSEQVEEGQEWRDLVFEFEEMDMAALGAQLQDKGNRGQLARSGQDGIADFVPNVLDCHGF